MSVWGLRFKVFRVAGLVVHLARKSLRSHEWDMVDGFCHCPAEFWIHLNAASDSPLAFFWLGSGHLLIRPACHSGSAMLTHYVLLKNHDAFAQPSSYQQISSSQSWWKKTGWGSTVHVPGDSCFHLLGMIHAAHAFWYWSLLGVMHRLRKQIVLSIARLCTTRSRMNPKMAVDTARYTRLLKCLENHLIFTHVPLA